ncbi:hybrid sensor histidine kinase/response regulator [Marinicauda salina]|uniref:histidine kinase n=1 Tax=Marinicauda salina TaxID=2135793 RepID=A0A2U2BWK6_9PROT|nr:ATP-binding protein [Marinicauda salina]PWE18401.1 hybrid sensor histidine kinase/response regulator [Marinicauda salina]
MTDPSRPTDAANPVDPRAVLDAMGDFVLVRDAAGRIRDVNAAFVAAFGGDRDDWLGRWFAIAPDGASGSGPRRYDAAMRTQAGAVWIEWSESPGPEGGSIAIGRDVTAEREARAAESEAARGKAMFFASVTHELRTPLSGALGAARLLADTPLKPDQASYLDAVKSSAAHALALIDDILDLSRLEAGRLELRAEPVDPRALVEDVCELLATRAAERGLTLAHAVDAGVPACIKADPHRLKQVVFNLAGNAVKFTETGGVLVTLLAREGRLRLTVRDTGPGIAKPDQARLFEHFERGAADRAGAAPGAGLGLAMVKRLADLMDGQIGVESEPGQGAAFWFDFPAEIEAGPPEARPLAGRTLIAASPDSIRREALLRQGEALGARVIAADRLEAARAALDKASEPIRTIVLDEAWAEHAVDLASAGDVRILVLARPSTKDRFAERPPGVDGWLVAPVRAASLAAFAGPETEDEAEEGWELAGAGAPLAGLAVLLAEDDPVNAMIARTVLERLGAAARHVQTGRAALEAAREDGFDAALLDLRMPEMDGRETAEAIRALPGEAGRLPLIALTANATEADRQACHDAGMDGFLTKPVDPDALRDQLAALCAPEKRARVG